MHNTRTKIFWLGIITVYHSCHFYQKNYISGCDRVNAAAGETIITILIINITVMNIKIIFVKFFTIFMNIITIEKVRLKEGKTAKITDIPGFLTQCMQSKVKILYPLSWLASSKDQWHNGHQCHHLNHHWHHWGFCMMARCGRTQTLWCIFSSTRFPSALSSMTTEPSKYYEDSEGVQYQWCLKGGKLWWGRWVTSPACGSHPGSLFTSGSRCFHQNPSWI